MKKKLNKLLNNAYAPYSKVKVSSIVKTKNGKEYEGVNIENASYGGTICAERSALTSAITAGTKIGDISEIHISSNVGRALYPCSICLQFMTEFLDANSKIYIHGNKKIIKTTIDELVPFKVTKESF